jgi:hypothetical protein
MAGIGYGRTMKLEYSDLSKEGLVIDPRGDCEGAGLTAPYARTPQDFLDIDRDFPEIVGMVPNLKEFAVGEDYNVGAFEIKAQGTDIVCVPENLDFLLPTTALIIDDFYAHAGASVAAQMQVSLQFFRHDYEMGEHLLFDQIHKHATEGKMVIYVVTAIDPGFGGDANVRGTEYFDPRVLGRRIRPAQRALSADDFRQQFASHGRTAAPSGAIVRFSENTLHAAPDISQVATMSGNFFGKASNRRLRRSLINIIASYKQEDGEIYGRTRAPNHHRDTPVEHIAEKCEAYRAAAERVMAQYRTKVSDPIG